LFLTLSRGGRVLSKTKKREKFEERRLKGRGHVFLHYFENWGAEDTFGIKYLGLTTQEARRGKEETVGRRVVRSSWGLFKGLKKLSLDW